MNSSDMKNVFDRSALRSSAALGSTADLIEIAKRSTSKDATDAVMHLITTLALSALEGGDGVSIVTRRHGEMSSVAFSDDSIYELDHVQIATGQGPCVAAATDGTWYHKQLFSDETKWPAFEELAARRGFQSVFSVPLIIGGHPVGSLNVYSRRFERFSARDRHLALALARGASEILRETDTTVSDAALARRVRRELGERELIAQAQGIIMDRESISAAQATTWMKCFAADTSEPLRKVAADIVMSTRDTANLRHRGAS